MGFSHNFPLSTQVLDFWRFLFFLTFKNDVYMEFGQNFRRPVNVAKGVFNRRSFCPPSLISDRIFRFLDEIPKKYSRFPPEKKQNSNKIESVC